MFTKFIPAEVGPPGVAQNSYNYMGMGFVSQGHRPKVAPAFTGRSRKFAKVWGDGDWQVVPVCYSWGGGGENER